MESLQPLSLRNRNENSLSLANLFLLLILSLSSTATLAIDLLGEFENCVSGGCDFVAEANRRFDDGLKSKTGALSKGALDELRPFIDEVLNNQILPFAEDLGFLVDKRIITARDASEALIKQIDSVLNKIVEKATVAVNRNILQPAFDRAVELEDKFFLDLAEATDSLDRVLGCNSEKMTKGLNDVLSFDFEWIGTLKRAVLPPPQCNIALGIPWNAKDKYMKLDQFHLRKCELLSNVNYESSAESILAVYAEIQREASLSICHFSGAGDSPGGRAQLLQEWLEAGRKLSLWKLAMEL